MTPQAAPALTILIVTWNGWQDTRRCLESVRGSAPPGSTVLVVDNASSDGTADKIGQRFPEVRVVRKAENVGHTRATNDGVRLVPGEYVLLLDNDTEVGPDSIGLMMDALRERPDVGILAPRTYNSDGSVQPSARRFPSPINGLFGRQSVLTRMFPNNRFSRRYLQMEAHSTTVPYEVEQVSSACMLFRRSLFESVGPWDEGYQGYWVDSDWCFWVRRKGWKILCVPQASVVHHEQNRAGRKRSVQRIWMFHYGAYRFYRNTQTLGVLDPRAMLAFMALGGRAVFQIAQNAFLDEPRPDFRADVDQS